MTQPAKVLAASGVRALLRRARGTRYASRNCLIILLSFKAGLRTCEIAGLIRSMVLNPRATLPHRLRSQAASHPG